MQSITVFTKNTSVGSRAASSFSLASFVASTKSPEVWKSMSTRALITICNLLSP